MSRTRFLSSRLADSEFAVVHSHPALAHPITETSHQNTFPYSALVSITHSHAERNKGRLLSTGASAIGVAFLLRL